MQLKEIIIDKIKTTGPISFKDFMEMSLYYPSLGYYTSAKDKIGHKGDYYTSPLLTPVFGELIGKQLEEMWRILDVDTFTIVECGAGVGYLSHDILNYFKNKPHLYSCLRYCIVEKSNTMREKAKAHLPEQITWLNSIRDLPVFTGCVLSNELLDNFAVHQVQMQDGLREIFIDFNNEEGFIELLKPAMRPLMEYLAEMNINLPEGFRTEINLEATEWIKDISDKIEKGYVLTIDYGYTSAELYNGSKSSGTLICYNKHTINNSMYEAIGSQDITAHVNFSALQLWGSKSGLNCCGYTNQANFLIGLGLTEHLNKQMEKEPPGSYIKYQRAAFVKYTLLMDMGNKFKVLIQSKATPERELLGLKLGAIA
jgi:SAM-dependent MidA family methyltransferase